MTERKPTGVSFESWIDANIGAAQRRGEFDNLPGAGKPFDWLNDPRRVHDPDWWVKSLMKREDLSYLPESLQLKADVEKWLERLPRLPHEDKVLEELAELNATIKKVNFTATAGPPSNVMPLKEERVLERWKRERPIYLASLSDRDDMPAAATESRLKRKGWFLRWFG